MGIGRTNDQHDEKVILAMPNSRRPDGRGWTRDFAHSLLHHEDRQRFALQRPRFKRRVSCVIRGTLPRDGWTRQRRGVSVSLGGAQNERRAYRTRR
jgi:hypothetical protein